MCSGDRSFPSIPDAQGNIWVFHRSDPAILEFDASGKLLKSFGAGMFVQAHGLTIDSEGNSGPQTHREKAGKVSRLLSSARMERSS